MIHNLRLYMNGGITRVCISGEDKDSVIDELMDAMNDRRPARAFNLGWSNLTSNLLVVNMTQVAFEYVNATADEIYQEPIDQILIIKESSIPTNPTTAFSEAK
jgi:hypothetical protein